MSLSDFCTLRLEHLTRIDGDGTGSSTPAPRALQASPAPHSSTNRFQPMTRGGTTGTVRCGETPRSCSTLRTCRQASSDPPPRWLTCSVSLMLQLNAMSGMLQRFARCVCKVCRVCSWGKYCAKVGALRSGSWNQVASGCHSPSPPPPLPPPSNCIHLMATSAHGAIFRACSNYFHFERIQTRVSN